MPKDKKKAKSTPKANSALKTADQVCVRLAEWRKKAGISQPKAAEMLGIKLRTYQNWEQRRRRPTGLALTTVEIFIKKAAIPAAA